MLEEINLLPFKRAVSLRERRVRFWLQIISALTLGIYILALISFSLYWFFLKNKNSNFINQIESLEQEIGGYRESELLYRKLVVKLQDLADILETRPDFLKVFSDLEALNLEGVEIKSVEAKDKGRLEIEGRADNSFFLDELTQKVLTNEDFQEATFSSVSKDRESKIIKFKLLIKRQFLPSEKDND